MPAERVDQARAADLLRAYTLLLAGGHDAEAYQVGLVILTAMTGYPVDGPRPGGAETSPAPD